MYGVGLFTDLALIIAVVIRLQLDIHWIIHSNCVIKLHQSVIKGS